ncbi:DEAD/DEAH box helicase [Sinorhizobium medicae]|nr:DEAD/DEAH box helicase [Sinorhizobium medicae]MDX0821296.1 DEAD/DEAH box helicase [Sinorhizobium medicae]MDX0864302.1 DEAD/DEAH box helicase [Sinorhizobium medicae]
MARTGRTGYAAPVGVDVRSTTKSALAISGIFHRLLIERQFRFSYLCEQVLSTALHNWIARMSFKQKTATTPAPATPVALLPLLTRRSIPDALSHQKDMLNSYAKKAEISDVAMQLPTGSGKTLVGLVIGEWRRRKFKERVVYLCPTRQLVHQTVKQAETMYGIDAVAFVGRKKDYSAASRADYTTRTKIAVATYSALFNSHTFFEDPDTIILDDAHSAENYIAKMWSLEIRRDDADLVALHAALSGLFKDHITAQSYRRLTGSWEDRLDATWVDKLPTETVSHLSNSLIDVLDAHLESSNNEVRFTWPLLRDHIHACHIYLGSNEILIRPLIPPTWTHEPFHNAKQRIYMSATLGNGGDLERLTGRRKIERIEAPEDFRKAGVGRRFFVFPDLSLEETESESLRKEMQITAGRSLVLTPNKSAAENVAKQLQNVPGFQIFKSESLEASKAAFVASSKAAAIMAGRFDGVDFPNDECRLLCLDGLPKATNAQERFFMSKMGASALLNDRMQTRILQAAGRCTRALQDRSTVFVTGRELVDYLTNERNWRHFHPELQSELSFGLLQSKDVTSADMMANFKSFLANDANWDQANGAIVSDAANYAMEPYPAMAELEAAVTHEISFQMALWTGDHDEALEQARQVVVKLNAAALAGYRALWHYLAGCAAQRLSTSSGDHYAKTAREQFVAAKKSAPSIPWLAQLAKGSPDHGQAPQDAPSTEVLTQVERLEGFLLSLGTSNDKKFEKRAKEIIGGLSNSSLFEEAQRQLGEMLGFDAGNSNGDADPDPWWLGSQTGIVFEDHANGQATTVFGATKAKQAAGHPDWLYEFKLEAKDLALTAILVTPCTKANIGAKPALNKIRYWELESFRQWAIEAINTVRSLKSTLPQEGDLYWRKDAAERLIKGRLTLESILASLPIASEAMEIDG